MISAQAIASITALVRRWWQAEIGDAAFAALYFLIWQADRCGARFASRLRREDARPDYARWQADCARLGGDEIARYLAACFARYQFTGVRLHASASLARWLDGKWDLRLREDIPTATEVLRMQVCGARPATVLVNAHRLMQPVLHKASPFAFLVHDLEHAYQFFHDSELHAGQRGFFARLAAAIDSGVFSQFGADVEFATKFDYLCGDMNTHPAHSREYLRAIVIEALLRQENKALGLPLSGASDARLADILAAVAAQNPAPRACRDSPAGGAAASPQRVVVP